MSVSDSAEPLRQHPLVSALRPDPAAPTLPVNQLIGFPADSGQPGCQRLYLSPQLDTYAEFALGDIVYSTVVPAQSSPFPGHEVVLVDIREAAQVNYVRSVPDDFEIDVRFEPTAVPRARISTSLLTGNTSCFPTGCATGPGTGTTPQ